MAQIKTQSVNWLDQAWRISSVIAETPDNPPGLLSESRKWPALRGHTKRMIELLQDTIALHLAYRAKAVHKASIILPDGDKAMFWLSSRDPAATVKHMALVIKCGVKFQPVDLWAYDAHIKLGRILLDGFVCKEWKRQLPLIVASIGGDFVGAVASLNATQRRVRTILLRDAKHRILADAKARIDRAGSLESLPTWKEILTSLQGDDLVSSWDSDGIEWTEYDEEVGDFRTRFTKTKTFQNW